jgi:uncharacterized protein YkwD
LDTLNALSVFSDGKPRMLRSAEQAQKHMRETLENVDKDGDGFTENQGDCDDADAAIYPAAMERCGDGIDQDCTGADLSCPSTEGDYETRLLELICDYRAENLRSRINTDPHLFELSVQHSEHMNATHNLSHEGFYDRADMSGYRYCVENVGWNYTTPEAQFEGWKNSEGHNLNMLNSHISHAGISQSGNYVTFFACGN